MIKIGAYIIKEERFPDGTLRLNLSDEVYDKITSYSVHNIWWLYDNDAELFTLQCLVDKIRTIQPKAMLSLELPYVPHARMDRAYSNDVFTLKTFCNLINAMEFTKVRILNPHSDVSTALLNNAIVTPTYGIETMRTIRNKVGIENFVCMYPDAGAAKKFSSIVQNDYIFGNKSRDWRTGKIKNYSLVTNDIDLTGKTVLIIDDISSYGGTFYYAAKALKDAGVSDVYLYIDHCENSVLEGDMIKSGLIEKIYTTDSIFTGEHEKIELVKRFRCHS